MKNITFVFLLVLSINVFAQETYDYTLLTYSQVGYNISLPKNAMVQNIDSTFLSTKAFFTLRRVSDDRKMLSGKIEAIGQKWNKYWWKIDFSNCITVGSYYLTVETEKKVLFESKKELPVIIGENLLWNKTWYETALAHLHIRDSLSYKPEGGWKDCGSTLQEVSSHIIMLNALCDLIELRKDKLSQTHRREVYEIRENLKVVTGNVAKTAMIFARISRIIKDVDFALSAEYLERSIKSYNWISKYGPVLHWDNSDNFAITHGAPYGMKKPPKEWMTRDLVMMLWASLELYKCGETEYMKNCIDYAQKIKDRQVIKENAEGGLYGHFYTYDSYDFTEKANIHCGAWNANYKAYNQGGHFPHYLIPLIEMIDLWPDNPNVESWKQCVHSFAFNYFIPATHQNPFNILPAGYYKNEGLLNWSGWYHGHNKIFGYAAGLAMEFYSLYNDERFIEIATGNLYWIAGLHSGFHENNPDFSASMIVGIGNRSKNDWDAMVGTIINGFEADAQFRLKRPSKETDLPLKFGDEGGIHHPAGWISGLTRLYYYLEN